MRFVIIFLVVLLSIAALYLYMPPVVVISMYSFLAIILLLILFKQNLMYVLLLWFLLDLLKAFGGLKFHMIPGFTPDRTLWVGLFSLFLLDTVLYKRKIMSGNLKVEAAMLLMCIYILISTIVSGTFFKAEKGLDISFLFTGYVVPFSIFFIAKNTINDESKINKTFLFFALAGLYLGITGIFEHFGLKQLVFPGYIMDPRVGIHFGRARGPFVQAAVNGSVIGMIFFMVFYLLFQNYKKWVKIFLIMTIVIMMITLLFTYTRACWLAFSMAILVIPLFYPKSRLAFISVVFILAVSAGIIMKFGPDSRTYTKKSLVGKENVSINEAVKERFGEAGPIYNRINLLAAELRMLADNPLFGSGFNTFQKLAPKYFSPIKGIPYARGEDTVNRHLSLEGSPMKNMVVIFIGIFIVFLINIEFIEMHFFEFPNSLFYMVAGIVAGLYQRSMQRPKLEAEDVAVIR
ncbi:MAG: O-antigen ligase family protein [Nitrospirae bacterium]|nr:O-antigen ligase family protein [Nitrospirota bacterium]